MDITEKLAQSLLELLKFADPNIGGRERVEAQEASYAAAVAALAEYEAKPVGFTVCIQEEHNTETTHVTFQEAATVEEAIELAKEECRADWGDSDEDGLFERDLHVFAVMRGDFDILEWNDQ